MTNPTDNTIPSTVFGYIRVSTERQDAEADGLERQAERIRQFCTERGLKLGGIYEDVGSAVADGNSSARLGLGDAIKLAHSAGAGLLVTDLTRIDRNLLSISKSLGALGMPLVSIRDGGVVSYPSVLEKVRRGGESAKNISEGTKRALGELKSSGVSLGSNGDKSAAAMASAIVRGQRAEEIVFQIADIMSEDAAFVDLSVPALAKLLNRRGIRTGWGREWTPASAKRSRKAALEVMKMRLGGEDEADPLAPRHDLNEGEPSIFKKDATQKVSIPIPDEPQITDQNTAGWGIF